MNFEVAGPEDFGRRAAEWVIGGAHALAGDVMARVAADTSVPKGRLTNGTPCGPAGAEWGFVSLVRTGKNGPRRSGKVIDDRAVAWAEKEAAKGLVALNLGFNVLKPSGLPGDRIMRFEAEVMEDSPRWCRVWFEAPETDLLESGKQEAWLDFMRTFCDQVNPSYGQISYFYGVPNLTAFETVTGPPWAMPPDALAASREVLRGYGWLTVCPGELAERLGGVAALEASGAFARVERLRSGGVWLLATDRFVDYTGERVESVWKAVAPVLRQGTPSRSRAEREGAPFQLVFRDAAEVPGPR